MTEAPKKATIMVVDDSPQEIQTALELLKDEYAVLAATSGEMAIEMIGNQPHPDLILLDVMMPGMDGYETCKAIQEKAPEIDVIFVSANTETAEIMKGYAAGGIDYVVKPVAPNILTSKINLAIGNRLARNQLANDAKQATSVAMTAMTSSGELSEVVHFMRNSFGIRTHKELAELLYDTICDYGLKSCIQIRSNHSTLNYAGKLPVSALEEELLSRMEHQSDRLFESGPRLFINDKLLTVLVKNMPIDDEEKQGRLRDYLAIIIEAAAEKVKTIDLELSLSAERLSSIHKVLEECTRTLHYFQKAQQAHKRDSINILDNTIAAMEETFMVIGLSDDQERELLGILNKGVDDSLAQFESSAELDQDLQNILQKLEFIAL